ncbi:MAG: FAD-dependent oxidoreductase, partial [Leptospiraceae bacterium]|nr:FAD-dependent oxidoreductase [Leptospiraceae bacterium]
MKIGIVGSGISGLGAAYFLKSRYGHEVDVFEKNDYAGGHTNTIEV